MGYAINNGKILKRTTSMQMQRASKLDFKERVYL
tara:strand:- start:18088 stop:18189 length:102 start_codon:yes stop_codon:yes gene_type:complete